MDRRGEGTELGLQLNDNGYQSRIPQTARSRCRREPLEPFPRDVSSGRALSVDIICNIINNITSIIIIIIIIIIFIIIIIIILFWRSLAQRG